MPILIGSLTFLLIIATTVTIAQSTQNCDPAYPKDLAGNEICIPTTRLRLQGYLLSEIRSSPT